jgi:hypothetical protein
MNPSILLVVVALWCHQSDEEEVSTLLNGTLPYADQFPSTALPGAQRAPIFAPHQQINLRPLFQTAQA